MNCLWEVMLKAKEQGVPEKNIRFQVSRAFSPYMEAVSYTHLTLPTIA